MYKAIPLETTSLEGHNKLLYMSVVDFEIERIFPVVQNLGVVPASMRLSDRTEDICFKQIGPMILFLPVGGVKAGGLRSEVGAGKKTGHILITRVLFMVGHT